MVWNALITTGKDDKNVLNQAQRAFINSIVIDIPMCDLDLRIYMVVEARAVILALSTSIEPICMI